MLAMVSSECIVENRPYSANDITVVRRIKDKTITSKWETYYFAAKKIDLFPLIIKEAIGNDTPMFRFWSKHCITLDEAKQHIADCLNTGKRL